MTGVAPRQSKTYKTIAILLCTAFPTSIVSLVLSGVDVGTSAGLPQEKERVPEFLEHVVMPDDTLTGICLKYKVGF